jgi:hypothetical protein
LANSSIYTFSSLTGRPVKVSLTSLNGALPTNLLATEGRLWILD